MATHYHDECEPRILVPPKTGKAGIVGALILGTIAITCPSCDQDEARIDARRLAFVERQDAKGVVENWSTALLGAACVDVAFIEQIILDKSSNGQRSEYVAEYEYQLTLCRPSRISLLLMKGSSGVSLVSDGKEFLATTRPGGIQSAGRVTGDLDSVVCEDRLGFRAMTMIQSIPMLEAIISDFKRTSLLKSGAFEYSAKQPANGDLEVDLVESTKITRMYFTGDEYGTLVRIEQSGRGKYSGTKIIIKFANWRLGQDSGLYVFDTKKL